MLEMLEGNHIFCSGLQYSIPCFNAISIFSDSLSFSSLFYYPDVIIFSCFKFVRNSINLSVGLDSDTYDHLKKECCKKFVQV